MWKIVTILLKGVCAMKTGPYSTYRGRKSWLRRILIAIVVLLVIALAAAIVGLFVLPNYVEYTSDGPRLVLPFFGKQGETTSPPTPDTVIDPTGVVIDTPPPSPSPSLAVTPPPAPDPDSLPPRRDAPLGLTGYAWPRLLDGSAKESLPKGRGAIFSLEDADFEDPALTVQTPQDLPYAAALVPYDPQDGETAIITCQTLASKGFDEVILTPAEGVSASDADTAAFYGDLRQALEDYHFNGRISIVAEKAPFQNDTALGRAMAEQFDRVYVPGGNWNGFNLYKYLKDNGFQGTTADIVTTVSKPISANYSWAILP